MKYPKPAGRPGFTIIEVLIVLAIVGIVLLILFLAVPSAKRNIRNVGRKRFAQLVATQMDQYADDHQHAYPLVPADMCVFVHGYVAENNDQEKAPCVPSYVHTKFKSPLSSGPIDRDCVLVSLTRYDVCVHEYDKVEHLYIGPPDEVSVTVGHWCNPGGPEPITSGAGVPYHETSRYAVYTALEGTNTPFCIDNNPN